MNKTFSQICLVVTFIGMSAAYSTSAVAQALASGSFGCTVEQIDPPSGVPWATATLYISDVVGIIGGPIENYVNIGTGSGLEAKCQELAETMSRVAQNQSCTVSAIQNTQEQGGNYIFNRWKFDLVCDGKQSTVVSAMSGLLKEMLTTPFVSSQTILKKSNEMRDNSAN